MVRVPGSSSDSGLYRESLSEAVKIKTEPGIEAPAKKRSSQTREDEGSSDRQSFGRGFDDKKIMRKIGCTIWKKTPNSLLRFLRGPPRIALQTTICKIKLLGESARFSFASEELSDMMKKEASSSEDFKKMAAVKQDRNVYTNN